MKCQVFCINISMVSLSGRGRGVGLQEDSGLRDGAEIVPDQRETQHPCQGGGAGVEQLQQRRLLHPWPRGGERCHREPRYRETCTLEQVQLQTTSECDGADVSESDESKEQVSHLLSRRSCRGSDHRPTSSRSRKCARSPLWFETRTDMVKPGSWTPTRERSLRRCSR